MTEKEKEELVKKVLHELENKKLINTTKSSFKSTEKLLYSYTALPDAVELLDGQINELKNHLPKLDSKVKSSHVVLNEKNLKYTYGDETLEARINELKQISLITKSQIKLIKKALKKLENEKYYRIIPLFYFERNTIESIAEILNCSVSTVSDNKKKIINKLRIFLFPDTFIKEL